jgi:hypothetical protein
MPNLEALGRTFRLSLSLLAFALGLVRTLHAQDVEDLKKGVVKITAQVEGKTQVGTGFVVRLEKGTAYIVTAAHVIEGDPKPQVAFHPRANEFLPAQVLGVEGGDPRGVALLAVKGNIPAETRAFSISTKAAVGGGESVTVIGFPAQTGTPWMVTVGTIGGRKGSDLTFSGVVGEGNSGSPLLLNGKVIGVITQMGSKVSYANPIAGVRFAVEGWGVKLIESDEALLPKEITGKDGVTMALVPRGDFLMGGKKQQVYLDAFYIDKTVADKRDWHESEKYCRDHGKRLPSEAEWEKAARRQFIASGKTMEWTADWFQGDYPDIRPLRNPKGPSEGEHNDSQIAQFDDRARNRAQEHADFVCAGYAAGHPEGQQVPKCTERDKRNRYQAELNYLRRNRPTADMAKVVRKDLDLREGYFSRQINLQFHCASDAK